MGTPDGIVMDAGDLDAFMTEAFGRPLGWTIEKVDLDGLRVRQPTGDGDQRPGGTVSGPTLMSLADGVAYMAVLSRIGPAALAVTSNLNINFLRRPRLVDLVAEGSLLKLGRTLAVAEVSLYSDGGEPEDLERPVAHATITYSLALLDGAGSNDALTKDDKGAT
jgi:uncharacterized protein (TIGR00369 family)